jgi:sulfate adenylyltransferase subunit 1 (EFTu-like GTPase family)
MQGSFVEKLPCELTRDEKLMKADQMAEHLKTRAEVELEASSVAGTFKRQLKELDRAIGDRAEEIRSGVEYRPVECAMRDRFRDNQVDTVRLDTGEIVRSRPMTIQERQGSLSLVDDDGENATRQ